MKKKMLCILLGLTLIMSFTSSSFATSNNQNANGNQAVKKDKYLKVKNVIPKQYLNKLSSEQLSQVFNVGSYAVVNAAIIMSADDNNEWTKNFEKGKFKVKKLIPIFDLNEDLVEVMAIFTSGYLISSVSTNETVRFSFNSDKEQYVDNNDAIYVAGHQYFAAKNNVVTDGQFNSKKVEKLKENPSLKEKKKYKKTKEVILNEDTQNQIVDNYFTGANEGTSLKNQISAPKTWLTNFYAISGNRVNSIVTADSFLRTVPEISQGNPPFLNSSDTNYANDCAVISTIEIMGWHFGALTNTQKRTIYNAITASSYFTNNGVWHNDNDQIFKIGAAAIGKPVQSTSDDVEDYFGTNSYNAMKDYVTDYGPIYLSMNQDPYGAHTVTVKGVIRYSINFTPSGSTTSYTNQADFIAINDHWDFSGDAYMTISGLGALTYVTAIVKN